MFLPLLRVENVTISEEKRLTQYLLRKLAITGREGRPIVNLSTSTPVEFGLGLIQMDLDERNKILTCSMWSRLVSISALEYIVEVL